MYLSIMQEKLRVVHRFRKKVGTHHTRVVSVLKVDGGNCRPSFYGGRATGGGTFDLIRCGEVGDIVVLQC